MTSGDLSEERLHPGDIVEHEEYGEVRVLGFEAEILSVTTSNIHRVVRVKFTTELEADVLPKRKMYSESREEFYKGTGVL